MSDLIQELNFAYHRECALNRPAPSDRTQSSEAAQSERWLELFATSLLPFALAWTESDENHGPDGPPTAVQIAGVTHSGNPWEHAANVIEMYESGEPLVATKVETAPSDRTQSGEDEKR